MFVEIKGNHEIFYAPKCEGNTLDITYPSRLSVPFLLNLDHVQQIYIGKLEPIEIEHRKEPIWTDLIGLNYIGFYIPNGSNEDSFTLLFKESAMGEFHRIKRIFDVLLS